jgi:hypothetical protein
MALSFWRYFHKGCGTIAIHQQFPDGIVEPDSMVVASISELIDSGGWPRPLLHPHAGAASMSVLNVVPQSGSKVWTKVNVEWPHDLEFQVVYHIETPPRPQP